jgi:hypothetical protein
MLLPPTNAATAGHSASARLAYLLGRAATAVAALPRHCQAHETVTHLCIQPPPLPKLYSRAESAATNHRLQPLDDQAQVGPDLILLPSVGEEGLQRPLMHRDQLPSCLPLSCLRVAARAAWPVEPVLRARWKIFV